MLPKFANNLFGHFPRTANTFRQGFFNSSQGSSAGGAKFNAGSRFYNSNGYTGTGRAVTQATSVNTQDEERELQIQRLSLLPRVSPVITGDIRLPHSRFNRVRRYSTSTATAAEVENFRVPPAPFQPVSAAQTRPSTPGVDPSAPQSVTEPQFSSTTELGEDNSQWVPRIQRAVLSGQYDRVKAEVKQYRSNCEKFTASGFNCAIAALSQTREVGTPVNDIIETYNDMLSKSIVPNLRTYRLMISVLCNRDYEVQRSIYGIENRMKRRELWNSLYATTPAHRFDMERLALLKKENPFNSALLIFQAASRLGRNVFTQSEYCDLLNSCGIHGSVDAAIRIFAHFERYANEVARVKIYSKLIAVYTSCNDVQGACEVFDEFRRLAGEGKIMWHPDDDASVHSKEGPTAGRSDSGRVAHSQIWTQMIKAYFAGGKPAEAIALLEEMLQTPNGLQFKGNEAPLPSPSTFATIISGFCDNGDIETGVKWMDRLLKQNTSCGSYHVPVLEPPRPSNQMWEIILDSLARASPHHVETLNRLWLARLEARERDSLKLDGIQRSIVMRANISYLEDLEAKGTLTHQKRKDIVDFLHKKVAYFSVWGVEDGIPLLTDISNKSIMSLLEHTLKVGDVEPSYNDLTLQIASDFIVDTTEALKTTTNRHENNAESQSLMDHRRLVINSIQSLLLAGIRNDDGHWVPKLKLKQALDFSHILLSVGHQSNRVIAPYYNRLYVQARKGGIPSLTSVQWSVLCHHVGHAVQHLGAWPSHVKPLDFPTLPNSDVFIDPKELLKDIQASGIEGDELPNLAKRSIVTGLVQFYGPSEAMNFLKSLGPNFENFGDGHPVTYVSQVTPASQVHPAPVPQAMATDLKQQHSNVPTTGLVIDDATSRYIDEYFPVNHSLTPRIGYERFQASIKKGLWPRAEVIGRLINYMGRLKETEAVKFLYNSAQRVLASMDGIKEQQSLAWFQVEDQMIIGWAHAGNLDAAHVHRERILQQGGTPSADAYGALISGISHTTDDVSSALQLWMESQERGVQPNLFLFNTIISRLAKARKAEHALELFQLMKAKNVLPSTVTYGAVITACCRVGDAISAERLFEEMRSARRYQPRIPPFNTIIQLFTTTKPDRDKVEHYHKLMKHEAIAPSDHTYKLLLDAYGTIQPVDVKAMWSVFDQIVNDKRVNLNGTHWASILNSVGCVQKNLVEAQEIFEKCVHHPQSRGVMPLPDAIVYEAMFNVLVSHHRTDLFVEYLQKMRQQNIHMTAYIANTLIRGYAAVGDIEEARSMFESLSDPPTGVAAPDNHVPHDPTQAKAVAPNAPVYREPSTWEAMVRGELGVGNRQEALALIQRMQLRGYPPAVLQRVSGIMHTEFIENSLYSTPTSVPVSPASDQSTFGNSTPPSSVY